jgi:hypothetical protein
LIAPLSRMADAPIGVCAGRVGVNEGAERVSSMILTKATHQIEHALRPAN